MQQVDPSQPARARVGYQVRALLALGLPLVGSHLVQTAIHVTDTMMMGWYDVTGLAALSLAGPIFYIVFILGSGFAFAVSPMVAQADERRDDRQTRRVTRMGLWQVILFGLIAAPAFFFAEPIFLAIGQEADVAAEAGRYMPYLGLGLLPALLVQVLKSYLSALELTRAILIAVIVAAVINVAANYAFIFGNLGAPEMGIAGAGLASLISHVLSLALIAGYAVLKRPDHALFQNFHKPDREAFRQVFRVGLPIGLTLLAETGLFAAATVMMGWLGKIPLAAHGIALQITSLTFMVPLGLSQAVTVRVGRALGQQDPVALRAASVAAMALAGGIALVVLTTLFVFAGPLIGLFVDPTDPERPAIIAIGIPLLWVAALFQLVDFGQVTALGMLRGVQDTRVPMIMAVVSYWGVGLPIAYGLGFVAEWGGVGIWLGLTAGLALACALMQARYWRRHIGEAMV